MSPILVYLLVAPSKPENERVTTGVNVPFVMSTPHAPQSHSLTLSPAKPVGPVKAPQVEQILVEFRLSGKTSFVPPRRLLYESCALNPP